VENAADQSSGSIDLSSLESINQIATAYWPAAIGVVLVMGLLAFGKREASAFVAGVAVVLQASLLLSAQ
jgi:hypothetical protein